MGNQQAKPLAKRKNYSFDAGEFNNFSMDKIMPTNVNRSHVSSSLDLKGQADLSAMPSLTKQSSAYITSKPKLSIKQQNAKLQKLTKTNDQLRKQLMQINKKLSDQLQKKKMPTLMANHAQKSTEKDKFKIIALKKQLQNAYSQVSMYKKQIQALKKNDSHQGDMKLQTVEDKITSTDMQINSTQKSLQSIKQVVGKQKFAIKGFEQQLTGEDVQQSKKEIVMLKDRLKKIKEISKKKEKDQKMRHQLLIQMERKLRAVNQQYVPEFKNWATQQPTQKSRVITKPKKQREKQRERQLNKNQQKQFRYLPSKLQIQQIQIQLKRQKQVHQDFHKKIDVQLKKRNDYRQQRTRIQEKLQSLQKNLQNLYYKKDRYMQLIMGNISVGAEGIDELLSVGDEELVRDNDVIVKGQNLQGQVEFSDRKNIKNYDKVVDKLRIVTISVWTNDKQHILAFQFYYTDGDTFFVGGKSAQFNVVTQKHTLELSQGDYVRNVMGIFNNKNKLLEFIVFESVKGKVLKVGKQSFKNNNFNLRIGKGQRPAMISGACVNDGSCWRVNRLDFLIKST